MGWGRSVPLDATCRARGASERARQVAPIGRVTDGRNDLQSAVSGEVDVNTPDSLVEHADARYADRDAGAEVVSNIGTRVHPWGVPEPVALLELRCDTVLSAPVFESVETSPLERSCESRADVGVQVRVQVVVLLIR